MSPIIIIATINNIATIAMIDNLYFSMKPLTVTHKNIPTATIKQPNAILPLLLS